MDLSVLAGALESPIVKTVLDKTISYLEEYKLQSDKTNLERLKDLLIAAQSVVEAAEKQQIQDKKFNDWLLNLKEIAYEADDLIDTFEYQHLEKKVERMAARFRLAFRNIEDIKELDSLVERLEMHVYNVDFIQLSLEGQSQKHAYISEQRTTSCFLPVEHSFVGRVEEKEEIINILLRQESSGAGIVTVLPILGNGGVGKTTLAQVVYNDEKVKKHFSLRMWVRVTRSFDVTKITREILEQADREANYSGITDFNTLEENLREKLSSKKILLVLDDIWNDTDKTSWDKLKAPLCYGKDGSMILLTSRLREVAKLMGTVNPIELKGLPEDEYWSLFKEQSFRDTNPEEHPRLEAIGKNIASMLKGSPLAAKTLGALLSGNLDADHWISKIWELKNGQDGIMSVLRLCYLYLPAHLRQCFAYLSIFPKNWQFERDDVIRMWMAQGMIYHDKRTKITEDVGNDYFNELISKSFFQPVNRLDEEIYTIHDLLHDLAGSVSKHDCFRIDGDEFRKFPATVRHLFLNVEHLGRLKESTVVLEELRTLILYGNFFDDPNYADLQDVLIQLKKIRLLALRRLRLQKCPANLSSLIHLRYLDLPCSESIEVQEELPMLCHLQTLELRTFLDGSWKHHVPAGITNLINLRHFIGDEDTLSKVPGIGKLNCLQTLNMFRVQRDPEFQIVQLKDLRELRGRLNIENLDCVDSKEEAEEANLCDKSYLEELCLVWDEEKNMKKLDEVEVGILEGLRPNPNLKWLKIDGYRGTLSPSWMVHNYSLTKLVSLTISNCRAWKELPPLGQLLWLKELRIFGMDAVKEVGTGFHGKDGFPSLELLILKDFSQWEEWSADEKVILFPHLVRFQIRGCPRLQSIPPLPTTLEELTLEDIGLTILQMASSRQFQGLSSLESLGISMLPKTISFPEGLTRLKKLQISGCEELSSIASFENLLSLQNLSITSCPKITIIIGLEQLTELKRLEISNCKELSSIPGREALPKLNEYIVDGCQKICMKDAGLPILPKSKSVVAEIFGSYTLQVLLDKTTSLLGENYELQSSVKTNLENLKDSLVAVQRVVKAAEKQQIQDGKLNDWLLYLKERAYEADDLIDTFEYLHLKQKVEGKSSVKSVLSPDDEIKELSFLVEQLERHASNVGNFIQLLRLEGQSQKHADISEQQRTPSCSLPFEHSFVGREMEKEAIIKILLSPELCRARNVPVLPILGVGGVGKTTLAQVVYNDEKVKKHFSLRMWVCVSESFDETRITRDILEQADREANYSGITSFKTLQENLEVNLSSEKFLLVLDDIWNETEKTSWDKLKAPLCHGKDGSMILLTSRLPEVAELMGTVYSIILKGLPAYEYWSLFKEQSFRGTNPEEHPRLEAIGKKIASKLEGSPLAAMTLGALLNDKLHVDHWESIFESKICELEKGQDGIMSVLRLCYLYLPAHLRQCFAYLSIFPKDWQFERDDVIRMWMAQGMIHHDNWTKRIEDVGKDYFNELISKSFFQPVIHDTDEYAIHDLLHDLAKSVSKDDCFRIDGDEFRTIPTTIRHLYLHGKHLGRLKESTVVLTKLRTLILHGNFSANPNADLQDVLIQLKKIRLLALRRCNLQKCHNLSNLIHLRYLDLPCSGSEEVPEELHKLYHLQTIELCKLRADCVLAGISNLINLRHFICHEDVISMVPGIGKLTCLQKLTMFRVQRDLDFQIVQLKDLRELCGRLNIENLDCVESKEEAEEVKLCEKGYLEELCLVWRKKKSMKLDEVEVGILEGLRPNPNLKWLIIDGYRGTLSPSWMVRNDSLVNLVSLTISNCRAWKELPPLGQLLWLKELRIFGMDAVKEVGTGFHGKDEFPSLELLILKDFSQWEEWSADEKVILFPHLVRFQIRGCPRLQSIPPLPTTLEELTLEDIGLTILPNLQMASSRPLDSLPSSSTSSLSSSLKTLTISNCVDKKSVGEWFPQHHNNLVDVSIGHGHERKPLLLNGFNKLIALERLNIEYCNIFVTSDTEEDSGLLPPSLEYLHLKNCFVADNIMLKCLQGLSSLESLGISMLPKIMTISFPEGLTRLKTLQISGCEELSSIASFKNLPSLQNLSITFCPKITIIPGLEQLTELKRLEISNCKELSSIPGREALPKLNEYIVDGCQKICMKDAGLPILPKSKSVVAGIFGSPTLQVLLDKTTSLLGENYELQSSVKTDLENLKDSLVAVQRVVKAAEKQQIQDGKLNDWLLYLKDLAYEADDLIDTFEYLHLKQKVEGKTSVISARDTVKSVLSPDDEIKELNFLVERLEKHASNVGNFNQLLRLEGQSQKHADISEQQRTPSCSLPFEHSFVGREMEKEAIINILLRTEPCGARNVPVLPILGVGGVGKTTLAQVVYNDEKVKKNFSLRMWVCVSESFDETRITRDILEQADREANYSGITSFKTLQENLQVNLISEKFLLVLDDIWNETAKKLWGILTTSLCYGKDGSMILLTSRLPEVAELMGTVYPIILRGLPEDEYWSLFKEQSFRGTNPKEHPRLEAIGKKIASKLKGSPLAAKTLGALLNDKLDVDHWRSKLRELKNAQDDIISALILCYLYLPAHLRQCFAYLSIFPKNWQFERDDVIRMWMAQGMVHHDNRTRRTEDVGKDYFNELISKSFFQPVNRYTDKYTIHDLLHSLAESFSKDDCFRIDGDEFRTIPTRIRHLYLDEKHLAKLKENKFVLGRLRTLILCGKFSANPNYADLQDVIRQLRKIRLFALRRLHLQKCPDNLSRLTLLRYLDLSGNHEIKKLPDELTMLYHLQTLNLFQLGFDHKLESMSKLISLRSLICSSRVLSMVAEIGELSGLQQLSCPFYVQNVPGFDLPQLKGLNSLGGCLCIRYLENVQSEEQAREARLSDKKNLVELDLHWGSAERNINLKVESGVLDGLEPPLNIEKLYINGYKGTRSPKWILPNFLVSVKLTSCSNWKELPALAECPHLEDLELSGMHAVHTFHSGGGGSDFQSLRKLTFEDLRELERWSIDGKSILFPMLETLRISGCPELKEIPQLPTIERLELFIVGLSRFPELPTKYSRVSVLSIKGCPVLESPGEWLLSQHENLEHLTELTVDPCDELDISLVKAINKLTGLKRLCIDSWPSYQEEEEGEGDCGLLEEEEEEEEEEEKGEEDDVNCKEEEEEEDCKEEDCGLLLESLESLDIINCVVAGKILSNSLQGLPALHSLRIDWCSGPTTLSFEEGLKRLTALNRLEVTNCRELTSLVGLGALFSLQDLKVIGCDKITEEGEEGGLPVLSTLCIDNTLLLKVLLSGQGLASLKQLEIIFSDEAKIDEKVFHPLISLGSLRFEGCHNLVTLPPLKNLHSLKKLEIEDCSNFQSLPSKEGLPPSLTHLVVFGCHPEFNKRYNMDDGPDWQTIRDIPCLRFD